MVGRLFCKNHLFLRMNFLNPTPNLRSLKKTAQGKVAKTHFPGSKTKTSNQISQFLALLSHSIKSGHSKGLGSVRAHSHTPCTPVSPFPPESSMTLPRGIQLLWLGVPVIPEGRNLSDTWHSLFQQTTAKSFPNPGLHYFEDQEAGAFPGQR